MAWHNIAADVLGGVSLDAAWAVFGEKWAAVKHPKGEGPMSMVISRTDAAIERGDFPADALDYQDPSVRRLVILSRELAHEAKGEQFPLSCRTAAEAIGTSHETAAKWIRMLVRDQVLAVRAEADKGKRKAKRYVYLLGDGYNEFLA